MQPEKFLDTRLSSKPCSKPTERVLIYNSQMDRQQYITLILAEMVPYNGQKLKCDYDAYVFGTIKVSERDPYTVVSPPFPKEMFAR